MSLPRGPSLYSLQLRQGVSGRNRYQGGRSSKTVSWHSGHLIIVRSWRRKRGKQLIFSICHLNSRQARELVFDANYTKNWLTIWTFITLLHFLLYVPPSCWAVRLSFRNNLSPISITDALEKVPQWCPNIPKGGACSAFVEQTLSSCAHLP